MKKFTNGFTSNLDQKIWTSINQKCQTRTYHFGTFDSLHRIWFFLVPNTFIWNALNVLSSSFQKCASVSSKSRNGFQWPFFIFPPFVLLNLVVLQKRNIFSATCFKFQVNVQTLRKIAPNFCGLLRIYYGSLIKHFIKKFIL